MAGLDEIEGELVETVTLVILVGILALAVFVYFQFKGIKIPGMPDFTSAAKSIHNYFYGDPGDSGLFGGTDDHGNSLPGWLQDWWQMLFQGNDGDDDGTPVTAYQAPTSQQIAVAQQQLPLVESSIANAAQQLQTNPGSILQQWGVF